ncbi:trypsin-like peptidase domain-containing protein [Streptomyces sp. NPDC051907]|uniref:VMAP-C domain-containing protein n=1 Tax=Streptomyces sp. NPDC051907 TaxID=3155284 RepID=UPI0034138FE3
MSWFRRPAAAAPRVSVLHQGAPTAAGSAALLSPRTVMTCAHVVNDALGRSLYDPAKPADCALHLAFHGAADARQSLTARLSVWVPPQRGPAMVWHGDLAVLRLDEPAPAWLRPVVWRDMAEGQSLRAWHGGGAPIAFADTRVKLQDGQFGYLDGELSGAAIGPGFSGGPLWSTEDATVVGLVVAHVMPGDGPMTSQTTVRRSWAVPWQAIRDELDRAGAADVVAQCAVHEAACPSAYAYPSAAQGDVAPAAGYSAELWSLLGDPVRRAQHARTLAARLGYEPPSGESAPSVEELAQLLASEERALATLAESLAPALTDAHGRAGLDRLLSLGRLTGTARLLSLDEHRFLVRELTPVAAADPALLPRVAREALRYLAPPRSLSGPRLAPGDVETAVTELEAHRDPADLPDGVPPVPALLTLVEYAAAVSAPPVREALQSWSGRVAARLGSHPAALQQRRADAAAWARYRPSPVVRLVAEISGRPDAFDCTLWEVRQDGEAALLVSPDRPRTAADIAKLIRAAAETSRDDGGQGVAHVDIVVGRDGIELPFDEWEAASSVEFLPRVPLGVKFRIALRCPEVSARVPRREAELRRRWEGRGAGPLVVDESCASQEQLYALLETSHRDTAQVVLHGPRSPREQLLQLCLAMGVPVVLWDRDAEGHEHAGRLDDVAPAGPLHQLPERIHHFRARQYRAGAPSSARPSLVWENTELPLPGGLELRDPEEGLLEPAEGADIR